MTWADNLTRIRRFLRDPNGKIWDDGQLLNLFNDAQRNLQLKTGYLEDARTVDVPPLYEGSYLQDWEWPFSDSPTGNHQALRYHEQSDMVFCYRWEPQAIWGLVDATASDVGARGTQPWEAWTSEPPGEAIPFQFPRGFHEARLVAWDREPLSAIHAKSIQQNDPSWAGRMGEPYAYWRFDKFEDRFCLYPMPSTVDWTDYEGDGEFLYRDTDEPDAEVGTVVDAEGFIVGVTGVEAGIATEVIDADNAVFFIYKAVPTTIVETSDESDFPSYLQKYIEYGTLERAYAADTDGQIKSLREYWAWRQEFGLLAIRKFMSLRRVDRDYRLTIKGAPGFRTKRQPRLPDAYPAVW